MGLDKNEMAALEELERALNAKIEYDKKDLDIPPRLQKTHTYNEKDGHVEKLLLKRELTWQQKSENPSINDAVTIPDAIGQLKYLKTLRIYINIKNLPESIGNLTMLSDFSLSVTDNKEKNMIQSLPETIGNWVNLVEFKLYACRIQSLPESVGNWKNLKNCYIDTTFLSDLPITCRNWSNLEEILLDRNHFNAVPAVACTWAKLNSFRMMENPLEDELHAYIQAVSISRDPYNTIKGTGIPIIKSLTLPKIMSLLPDESQVKALSFPPLNVPFGEVRKGFKTIFGNKYTDYECVTDDDIEQILSQPNATVPISKFDPNLIIAYMNQLVNRGEYNQARTVAQTLKKVNPNLNVQSLQGYSGAMFIGKSDFDQAMQKVFNDNKEQFKDLEKRIILAFSKRRVGKFNEAIPLYQYLADKLIGSAQYDMYLAHIYLRQGNKAEALKEFNIVKQKLWNFNCDYPLKLIDGIIAKNS